jgi:putative PIN family toxin of toxin-antitoxin system
MRKSKTDRLVLDTNVFLSAYLSGKFERIAQLPFRFGILIYTCDELNDELWRNLNDKRIEKHLKDSPQNILDKIEKITLHTTIDLRFDRAADIKDNFLFDLAYSVKAYYLVTYEKALLNMKHVNQIQIIAPEELFRILKMSAG